MGTSVEASEAQSAERRDALVGRLFQGMLGAMDLFTVYMGDRLGLYEALMEAGPVTAAGLAAKTGTQERYAREWLEQQAVTGILDVEETGDQASRRYSLPAGHAEVLTDRSSLNYLSFLSRFTACIGQQLPALLDTFRHGGGVPWSAYGADAREAQADQNRVLFLTTLGKEWLPTISDVHVRLQADPPARVADIGCGAGWSSIAMAQAYPRVQVDGFDLDEASVELARGNAAEAGLSDRVHFEARDGSDPALAGRYDFAIACECVHDMARPVEVLATVRRMLNAGGSMLIDDERVAESFVAPGDEMERLFYGFSVLACLPNGMAESPSVGTGTVMRPDTLRRYAQEAGFGDTQVLPIEHEFFRFYHLMP